MRKLALAGMLLVSGTAHTMQRPEVRPLSDEEIRADLKDGEEVEGRVDGDMNGDGDIDTAWIVRGEDSRSLYVRFAARGEYDLSYEPAGRTMLDAYPLGPAEMRISRGVLVVKDLTGGTTAISATYRFRGEKARPKLRLIGLDATLYSRTWAHDGAEMSWNLLTGDVLATKLKLVASGGNATYDKSIVRRFKRPIKAYYMRTRPASKRRWTWR